MTTTLSDRDFTAFQTLIHDVAGIDLAANKRNMLAARLTHRLEALGLRDYRAYYELVTSGDPKGVERERLINSVTTNMTSFFRESYHFDFVRDRVIPELRARVARGAPRRLRIWSAACSTGEEAYSLAMVAHRALAHEGYAIEIHASDIDTDVLQRASDPTYKDAQVASIPPDLRSRYLERRKGGWGVTEEIRGLLRFHHINLLRDVFPFQGPFEAIFLRNVIIYFNRPDQTRLFQRLRGYLGDPSYMFIGHSESLLHISTEFEPAGQTIYRPVPRTTRKRRETRRDTRRRRRTTYVSAIARVEVGDVFASHQPMRIDAVVGPCVSACLFDPEAKVGGMTRFHTTMAHQPGAADQVEQLVARLEQMGAHRQRLRAKLVGGGVLSKLSADDDIRDIKIATAAIERVGVSITSQRVGGDGRLEVRFYTHSGRLLCRDFAESPRGT